MSAQRTRSEVVKPTMPADDAKPNVVTIGVFADGADLSRIDDKTYR